MYTKLIRKNGLSISGQYMDTGFHFYTTHDFDDATHIIFGTWQGTLNPDTKAHFPEAKNAKAQPIHPSERNSFYCSKIS